MIQLTPHTPSVRAQLVARRTYQRPLNAEGTVFETWEQTVDRVIGHQKWLWERARGGQALEAPQLEELEVLRHLIVNRAAFMSGRTMWLGGTEVSKRREASMVNCFGRETPFITSEGVRSFEDFEDGDSVCVQDHLGAWKNAVVKSFGKQALYDIEFRRGRSSQKVRATKDHTWILASGERTNSLTVGDRIHRPADPMNSWDFYSSNPLERLYWCYGFTFGDGSTLPDAQGVHRWSSVRLCSAKSQFADRFSDMGFSTSQPLSCKGDFVAHTGTYLKTLPDISIDGVDMVRAFVRGYLDADGAKSKNAHRGTGNLFSTIQVTGSETIKWVRRNFPAVGVYITSEATPPMVTNYGERSGETVTFRLCTSFGSAANGTYSVHSITPSSEEVVWCLQVEDTHSFTLPNGITTGNCSFLRVETVYDVVDAFWLLLQGAGVGFEPIVGSLNGFPRPLEVQTIRSARTLGDGLTGRENNVETVVDGVWTIRIGDSAEAWAKSVGKILAGKRKAHTLVLDFSAIRAAGSRLGGYGWISSGDGPLHEAMLKICDLMNSRIDSLMTRIDILDLMNLLGTTLSSRRSAQIALMPAGDIEADEFAMAKKDCFTNGKHHRGQSNNSVMFSVKPSVAELRGLFATMEDAGGSEPGFINMTSAKVRAPWVSGFNPCAEQCLANKGVCNLSELVLTRFPTRTAARAAIRILARANYRQTCINLDDGILQRSWHEVNDHLHLCGVGLTGISQWQGLVSDPTSALRALRMAAQVAAEDMADELGLARPKHVTTTKPSGCRPAHAITTTTGGVLTLAEIFSDHGDDDTWSEYRGTTRASLHGGVTRPITRTFVNGEAEVLRVRMAYGAVVESTRDHPWFVVGRGWCAAESLRPGDVIESSIGHYKSLVPTRLVNVPSLALRMRGDATIIKQPTHMNDDLAWLLGFLWGDGCMSPSRMRIRFTDGVDITLQKVQRVMQEQFGLHADIERPAGRRVGNLTYASAHLWHWLAANEVFKLYSSDLEVIPLAIRSSARRHIISFLAGLCDADANIAANARGKNVILSMASERFATHVQDVAAAVGIMFGRSHNTQGPNFQPGGKSIWLMTVGGRTQQDAGEIFWGASCKCQYVDLTALDTVWPWEKGNLRDLPANEIGRVFEVSSIGTQPTYDIEVAEEHWFFAGIYRSHNTLSKVADCSEGVHDALGEYIINTIMLSAHDPLVGQLQAANYRVRPHPQLQESMLVEVPIHFPGATGRPASAIEQLERYKLMMQCYVDSNCSITVSYGQDEVRDICAWLYANWDLYVGVSFMPRIDATRTAEDLGYSYLPQAVITREAYEAYASTLLPVDLDAVAGNDLLGDDCAGGVCPVR